MNEIALKNEKAAVGAAESVLEPKAGERLREISAPAYLINGDLDEPIITTALDTMAAEIPQASREIIRDAAHFLIIYLNVLKNLRLLAKSLKLEVPIK